MKTLKTLKIRNCYECPLRMEDYSREWFCTYRIRYEEEDNTTIIKKTNEFPGDCPL